jgi:hypothetical protein
MAERGAQANEAESRLAGMLRQRRSSAGAIRSLFQLRGRSVGYWYRRGRGCLWAKAGCHLGTPIETAGYAPHDSNAARLIGNDRVKLRIRELQEQAAMSVNITLQGQIEKLESLLEQAMLLKQISAGVAAVDKQNELMGLKVQRVESKRVDQFENMSDEELRQYVYGTKELDA